MSENELREALGLPKLKPGIVICLSCDEKFWSWDRANNRICPECKRKRLGEYDEDLSPDAPDREIEIDPDYWSYSTDNYEIVEELNKRIKNGTI